MDLILVLLVGIGLGMTVFPVKWLKVNSWVQLVGIGVMLFFLGASTSASPTFLTDIKTAGVQSILMMLAASAGAAVLVYFLTRIFMKEGKKE